MVEIHSSAFFYFVCISIYTNAAEIYMGGMGFCLSGSFQAGGEEKGPHVHKKAAEDILYLPAIQPRAK